MSQICSAIGAAKRVIADPSGLAQSAKIRLPTGSVNDFRGFIHNLWP